MTSKFLTIIYKMDYVSSLDDSLLFCPPRSSHVEQPPVLSCTRSTLSLLQTYHSHCISRCPWGRLLLRGCGRAPKAQRCGEVPTSGRFPPWSLGWRFFLGATSEETGPCVSGLASHPKRSFTLHPTPPCCLLLSKDKATGSALEKGQLMTKRQWAQQ